MDSIDPYRPPEAPLEMPRPIAEMAMATQGRRFANYILDNLFETLLWLLLPSLYVSFTGDESVLGTEGDLLVGYLQGLLSMLLYYLFFEGIWGRTPAKWVTGTRAVREDGSAMSFGTVVIRSLARFIPFEPFSFLWGDPRGWHDTLSKTKVVRTR